MSDPVAEQTEATLAAARDMQLAVDRLINWAASQDHPDAMRLVKGIRAAMLRTESELVGISLAEDGFEWPKLSDPEVESTE